MVSGIKWHERMPDRQEGPSGQANWERLVKIESYIQSPQEAFVHKDIGTGLERPTANLQWRVGLWKELFKEFVNPTAPLDEDSLP